MQTLTGAGAAAASNPIIWARGAIWLGADPQEAPLCIEGAMRISMHRGPANVHVRQTESVPPTPAAGSVEFPAARPELGMQFGCSRPVSQRHPGGILAESSRHSCGILVGIHRTCIWVFSYSIPSGTAHGHTGIIFAWGFGQNRRPRTATKPR